MGKMSDIVIKGEEIVELKHEIYVKINELVDKCINYTVDDMDAFNSFNSEDGVE